MVLIPHVGFGGKDTADNVSGREEKTHMAKPRAAKPVHVSVSRIVKNLALGIEGRPPSPMDFLWSSVIAKGHKTNRALHKSDGAGEGENQFVSRQIGFL